MNASNSAGPLLVRLAVGLVATIHGVGKLFGVGPAAMPVPGFSEFLAGLGLPAPSLLAWLVAVVEAGGGLLVLLGLLTRVAALLIAINMFAATALVHLPEGYADSELTLVLGLAALSLVASGAGRFSAAAVVADDDGRGSAASALD